MVVGVEGKKFASTKTVNIRLREWFTHDTTCELQTHCTKLQEGIDACHSHKGKKMEQVHIIVTRSPWASMCEGIICSCYYASILRCCLPCILPWHPKWLPLWISSTTGICFWNITQSRSVVPVNSLWPKEMFNTVQQLHSRAEVLSTQDESASSKLRADVGV